MPRYFFDVFDGHRTTRDELGLDVADLSQVRHEAIDALPDVAREQLPDGDDTAFFVLVRDESGQQIFKATLALKAEWLLEKKN